MVGESQAAHKRMFGNRGALFQGFGHAYQYTEQGESWSELSKLFSLSRDQGQGEQPVWQSGKLPTAQHPSTSGNTILGGSGMETSPAAFHPQPSHGS